MTYHAPRGTLYPMKTCRTITVNLYVAGDLATARQVCREYVAKGGCVTVAPCDYVYTGGCEAGVVIGFINYPPYAKLASDDIVADAVTLGEILRTRLCQSSFTVVGPNETTTYGRD